MNNENGGKERKVGWKFIKYPTYSSQVPLFAIMWKKNEKYGGWESRENMKNNNKKAENIEKWQKGGARKMQGMYMQNMGAKWKNEKFKSHNIYRNIWKYVLPISPPAPQFSFHNNIVRVVEY